MSFEDHFALGMIAGGAICIGCLLVSILKELKRFNDREESK